MTMAIKLVLNNEMVCGMECQIIIEGNTAAECIAHLKVLTATNSEKEDKNEVTKKIVSTLKAPYALDTHTVFNKDS